MLSMRLVATLVLAGAAPLALSAAAPIGGEAAANVFLEGAPVLIAWPREAPASAATAWRILDDGGSTVAGGAPAGPAAGREPIDAGRLGIGWYRVEFLDGDGGCAGWTTAAVIAKLAAPVPRDSPVCLDTAVAWFARGNPLGQERHARLAALAGVAWTRDRLSWRDMEPSKGAFAERTTYDTAAEAQTAHGLDVLQVFHDTPAWAADPTEKRGRFARDLRDVYRFCRAMGARFAGRVRAWEPWNEANIESFGGHTAAEMCAFQKAAYLGFKAGDPAVIVGWNAYAGVPAPLHTKGVLANETWPYFDTYNIHTYDWPDSYVANWAPAREAACGKPLWITEADRGMKYETGAPWHELPRHGEILKAHFMAQSYATSVFAGASRHFHFILGHYTEDWNGVQFGLLRRDFTPRPAYAALAAIGRFLAGARALGRQRIDPHGHVYAFRAAPDGAEGDVLVAWAEKPSDWPDRGKTSAAWSLPAGVVPSAVYDYLGRPLSAGVPATLGSAPIFVLLPRGAAAKLALEAPPEAAARRPGEPTPIVLQIHVPSDARQKIEVVQWAGEYDHVIAVEADVDLRIFAYNFGAGAASGTIAVEHAPSGWDLAPRAWSMALEPFDRRPLDLRVRRPKGVPGDKTADTWVVLRGDFGAAGRPVLAFRLAAFPGEGYDR
ncbi:MAG TPA: hypothetical protein PKX48_03665 [Planctomycetota bacterium]|jgi:hypothetical protein|nr:hypothetical protein [Planctomycetota bacterium]OQC20515.1 MAG: hypothetical protein BWX69_01711 [Planctomycetes bacterium ADurb.Bin069]HNR97959.1 hypothetical protein [Planctomycetota bacterium]HNU24515.1 hypothetical protein [Planctomycetota bacterium]HOE29095.1 hypothetical protein [Planctomycetota bacterium]